MSLPTACLQPVPSSTSSCVWPLPLPYVSACLSLIQALKAVRAAEAEVAKRDYRILHLARSLKAAQQQGSS